MPNQIKCKCITIGCNQKSLRIPLQQNRGYAKSLSKQSPTHQYLPLKKHMRPIYHVTSPMVYQHQTLQICSSCSIQQFQSHAICFVCYFLFTVLSASGHYLGSPRLRGVDDCFDYSSSETFSIYSMIHAVLFLSCQFNGRCRYYTVLRGRLCMAKADIH